MSFFSLPTGSTRLCDIWKRQGMLTEAERTTNKNQRLAYKSSRVRGRGWWFFNQTVVSVAVAAAGHHRHCNCNNRPWLRTTSYGHTHAHPISPYRIIFSSSPSAEKFQMNYYLSLSLFLENQLLARNHCSNASISLALRTDYTTCTIAVCLF